ncbi:hypothetical protein [Ferrovibrio xuzhouensis]|uniref:Uncharacterized protein n=1 Tax=Ferrovibrio xuzhouensis TaxID=1576914 RepID=A0ABV7VKC7_9PROT
MTREIELRIHRLSLVGKTPAEARAFIRAMERALTAQLAAAPVQPDATLAVPRHQADLQVAAQPRAAAAALHKLVTK